MPNRDKNDADPLHNCKGAYMQEEYEGMNIRNQICSNNRETKATKKKRVRGAHENTSSRAQSAQKRAVHSAETTKHNVKTRSPVRPSENVTLRCRRYFGEIDEECRDGE